MLLSKIPRHPYRLSINYIQEKWIRFIPLDKHLLLEVREQTLFPDFFCPLLCDTLSSDKLFFWLLCRYTKKLKN